MKPIRRLSSVAGAFLASVALAVTFTGSASRPLPPPAAAAPLPVQSDPRLGRGPATQPEHEAAKVRAASTDVSLAAFGSCDDFLDHARGQLARSIGPWGIDDWGLDHGFPGSGVTAPAMAASGGGPALAPIPIHSETNVQERGVDEPDILKTDGRLMLVVDRWTLRAIDVSGEQAVARDTLDLPIGSSYELLLIGSRALVLSSQWGPSDVGRHATGTTRIDVVDVSDPAALRIERTLTVDGRYVSARLIDGVARVVVRSSPRIASVYPDDDEPRALRAAEASNRARVLASTTDQWIPRIAVRSGKNSPHVEPLVACEKVYRPSVFSGASTVTVFSVDPVAGSAAGASSVLADAEHVYATADALFVATTEWAPDDGSVDRTDLHMFDISDARAPAYVSSASVRGDLLSSWALSYHDGHLRVASTAHDVDRSWVTNNMVTVLDARGGVLEEVGRVDGLGRPGEEIRGVRFIGDRAYLVTFRQIDPFYVLDLADPRNPIVKGELKVPGYSAYLHPVGEDRMLGIGSNGDLDGRVTGGQVSLFDVSDPARPTRLSNLTFEGSTSVEWQGHHAVMYWPQTSTMFVPVSDVTDGEWFNGVVAIRVDDDELIESGRISHPRRDVDWFDSSITREAVVGDSLFTLSQRGLLQSDLTSFEKRTWLWWEEEFSSVRTHAGGKRGLRDGYRARFDRPGQLATSRDGMMYLADAGNKRVRRMPQGWWGNQVSTVSFRPSGAAEGGPMQEELPDEPTGVAVGRDGSLFVATRCGVWQISDPKTEDARLRSIAGFPGPCPPAGAVAIDGRGAAATFGSVAHLAVDGDVLFAADEAAHTIRRIEVLKGTGHVTTVAGLAGVSGDADGSLTQARFRSPHSISVTELGLVVADTGNGALRLIADGKVTTIARGLRAPVAAVFDTVGERFIVAESGRHAVTAVRDGKAKILAGGVRGYRDGKPVRARFASPGSILWGADGSLLVTDTANHRLRSMTPLSWWY